MAYQVEVNDESDKKDTDYRHVLIGYEKESNMWQEVIEYAYKRKGEALKREMAPNRNT